MKKMVYLVVISIFIIGCLSIIYGTKLMLKNIEIKGLKTEIDISVKKVKEKINERNILNDKNNTLKNNLSKILVEKKDWFVINTESISSEPDGKGVIIFLPEKLERIDYSKYGFQNPEFGTKIRFEYYFSDDDIGNRLFNNRIIYNYMY